MNHTTRGFTLIEVLIALMITAIGLTALLKTITFNIHTATRLQDKTIQHMVAMNAIAQIQTNMFYWRANFSATPIRSMRQITLRISQHQAGPFISPLIAFRYMP
jgi:general secretion pathway protein I